MTSVDERRAFAGWGEVALATGAVAVARSTGPTITHAGGLRPLLAGQALAVGALAGLAGEGVARGLDAATGLDRMQSHLAVAAVGVAGAIVGRRATGLAGATTASMGAALAVTGGAGAVLDAAHGRFDRDGDGRFGPDLPNGLLAAGAGALGVAAAARYGKTALTALRNAKHVAAGGPAADEAGRALGELVPRSKLSIAGRMFLEGTTPGLPSRPVRTYMPFRLDDMTLQQRAALAVESMVQQGAFDKSRITFASPTGTGGINPGPIAMDEILSGGDTAWVVAQYGKKPSVQSLHKTPQAREAFMELIRQAAAKRAELFPAGGGPDFYASATSLGSLNLHSAIARHGDELFGPGIDLKRVLLLGAPEALSELRPGVLPEGMLGRFRTPGEVAAVTGDAAERMRVVDFAHLDDPVRTVSLRGLVDRSAIPGTDGVVGSAAGNRRFTPAISFLEHANDVTTSISRGTGDTVSNVGHDYRQDMAEAVALAFGHRGAGAEAIEAASRRSQQLAVENVQRIKRILAGQG